MNHIHLIGITVGIRYSKSFRIPDLSGDIIDNVLYKETSPFSNNFFTKVQEQSNREKILYNEITSNYFRITTDDLIFGITLKNDFEKQYKWISTDVLNFLTDEIFKAYKLKSIKRLGIIFHHKIDKNPTLTEAVSNLTSSKITEPENVTISFSKKLSSEIALFRKGVSDFRNTIYAFEEAEDGFFANLDYQYHYNPPIEDFRDCYPSKFLEEAKNFLENNYYDWLTKNYEKNQ